MKKEQKNKNIERILYKKPKPIFRLIVSILIIILVILVLIVLTYHKPGTGFAIALDHYNNLGYAFTIPPDNFNLNSSQTLSISVNVSKPNGYVYRTGYFFNANLSQWSPFTFPKATVSGSN